MAGELGVLRAPAEGRGLPGGGRGQAEVLATDASSPGACLAQDVPRDPELRSGHPGAPRAAPGTSWESGSSGGRAGWVPCKVLGRNPSERTPFGKRWGILGQQQRCGEEPRVPLLPSEVCCSKSQAGRQDPVQDAETPLLLPSTPVGHLLGFLPPALALAPRSLPQHRQDGAGDAFCSPQPFAHK